MSCARAKAWEKRFFAPENAGTEPPPQERDFMRRAGTRIGDFVLSRLGGRAPAHLLVLSGKGHNGGDALIAARRVLNAFPRGSVPAKIVFFAEDWDALAPLTMDAYEDFLRDCGKAPALFLTEKSLGGLDEFLPRARGGVVLDGVYGHGFRPPLREHVGEAFTRLNALGEGDLRVSVDLPSGVSDSPVSVRAFAADFTCATGILKTPLLDPANARVVGRVVPLAIGFPVEEKRVCAADTRLALERVPARRPAFCDKRTFGHALIVGGSRAMPGALLLNALAALRAGAGLVSVLCPRSVHAAFAARAPGAMWIPCEETPEGALELRDALEKFRKFSAKASVVLCGSGLGDSPDAQALARSVAAETPEAAALVLDADALRPAVLSALRRRGENVLLPHHGEFLRLGGDPKDPETAARANPRISALALKGTFTEIIDAETRLITSAGTPALARGGSGDVLAGLTAALFAERAARRDAPTPADLLTQAVCWHGAAAQLWELAQGTRTADVSALPDFFADALR
ncbi:MAG: NAD(P)H-hydrate dehydratase [Candidatus Spyradosoma sp.]